MNFYFYFYLISIKKNWISEVLWDADDTEYDETQEQEQEDSEVEA
jgi:hypothetical protein